MVWILFAWCAFCCQTSRGLEIQFNLLDRQPSRFITTHWYGWHCSVLRAYSLSLCQPLFELFRLLQLLSFNNLECFILLSLVFLDFLLLLRLINDHLFLRVEYGKFHRILKLLSFTVLLSKLLLFILFSLVLTTATSIPLLLQVTWELLFNSKWLFELSISHATDDGLLQVML